MMGIGVNGKNGPQTLEFVGMWVETKHEVDYVMIRIWLTEELIVPAMSLTLKDSIQMEFKNR